MSDRTPPNPSGLCQCGCGERTSVLRHDRRDRGYLAGDHRRFVSGHQTRGRHHPKWDGGKITNWAGYTCIHAPDHPNADATGYVREHIAIVAEAMGRPLPKGACVHHVNGDRADNRRANLVVCDSDAYHVLLHKRERALDACGHAGWLKCRYCKEYGDPNGSDMYVLPDGTAGHHRSCANEYMRKRRLAA